MNIRKPLLIITAVGATGILSAMDSNPLKHADIIDIMLKNETFPFPKPIVDYHGKIYTLISSSHDTHDYIESFCYRLEKPINSLKILNYKTDIVRFLHFVRANDTVDNKKNCLLDQEKIKGSFTQTYKINYHTIAKAGAILAAGVALIISIQS